MARMTGHRRRVQFASALLLMVVVAGAGIGRVDSASASIHPRATGDAGPSGTAEVSIAVRAFGDPQLSEPGKLAAEPRKESKVVYLTFDDGPSRHTKPVLRLLDEYDAKATFFLVGENAVANPGLARSVISRGHVVGSHTWNHRDMRRLRPARLTGQITRTSRVLSRITAQPVTCLRPPYGAVNRRVRTAIRHHELALKMWDVDPRDWKRPGAAAIAGRVVSRTDPGDVILLHDGGGNRSQTVRALGRILRTLSDRGYTFETLPDC